ncbi:unnamed protein product [Cuscuta campestris]|uniref:Uncharacterized protein n=1 Tax=Cuscuta campestris TaxID=132261 RepID=A0A484M7B5_9ASTE|nr:unnamed protein product [Cuscuta campestris]
MSRRWLEYFPTVVGLAGLLTVVGFVLVVGMRALVSLAGVVGASKDGGAGSGKGKGGEGKLEIQRPIL